MKYRVFALFLSLLLLSGCGNAQSTAETAPPEETLQAFGQMLEDAEPEQAAQTTAVTGPAVATAPETEREEEAAPTMSPEEAEKVSSDDPETEAVLTALIMIRETDGLSYDANDPVSVLRGFGYLTGLMKEMDTRLSVSGSTATVKESTAKEYVYALFGGFDGNFPAVTEEDPLVKDSGSKYAVNLVDLGALELQMSARSENPDGTYTITAGLTIDGRTLPEYNFTLTDFKGGSGGIFSYSVIAMERAA